MRFSLLVIGILPNLTTKHSTSNTKFLDKIQHWPVVIGALGSVTKEFDKWIEQLEITCTLGIGNCKNIEESVGNIENRPFLVICYALLIEEVTAITTARKQCVTYEILI